mgnify:CR=1 FL=1
MSTFSEILKRERENKGYSKAELARKLNIPYTTYQNYENGREPKIDVIKQISEELGINPSVFFDLENIRQVVQGQYPKQYEWYAAFGLSFTLKLIVALFNSMMSICFNWTGLVGFIVFTAVTKSVVSKLFTFALFISVLFTLTEILLPNLFSSFALREILYI